MFYGADHALASLRESNLTLAIISCEIASNHDPTRY